MSERVWFITGSSTGFGRALAEVALERGERVVATARKPEQVEDLERDHPDLAKAVRLDVTDAAQVREAVQAAVEAFGRIDVVVNNAGYGLFGAFEESSDEQVRWQIEVNLFGAMNVTREVLPLMREQGSGHLLQVSSIGGQIGGLGVSAYNASKWGLEGFSEAVSKEVAPFGVRVTIVEPGPFRTDWAGRSMIKSDPMPEYDVAMGDRREGMESQNGNQPGDPVKAAHAMIRVVESDDPPLRLPLGGSSVTIIRDHMRAQQADLDAWEDVSTSTDYESGRRPDSRE